ncbi:Hint domain-containing protein [Aliiroseovarius sediminis]|uniref:Hint domain-containing protein n=1 Tax=Aliiroseovarius sediminis TaxID=2925839 RepID=UPI001F56E08D|nr:Hint domain-containing protein [Aliiroseovarius sediminis]MCI2394487.1 Hint domain-containing protein [Aliiroseovarius sediminis]
MGNPIIGGDLTGQIDVGDADVFGDLDDVGDTADQPDSFTVSDQAVYGLASINEETGEWTYSLDSTNPAVQALDVGETLTDTFEVRLASGRRTTTDTVTITITGVPCFAAGTLIDTPHGPRKIESLKAGDMVTTATGVQPILWIGSRDIDSEQLDADPKLRPVRITAGALGAGLPLRDLLVSRQHRMLVRSDLARQMFSEKEVLISAIKLADLPNVFVDDKVQSVTYFHLLFQQHEIIFAEGAPSESLLTGPEALKMVGPENRTEICAILPDTTKPARQIPSGKAQKQLVERHARTQDPIINGV